MAFVPQMFDTRNQDGYRSWLVFLLHLPSQEDAVFTVKGALSFPLGSTWFASYSAVALMPPEALDIP